MRELGNSAASVCARTILSVIVSELLAQRPTTAVERLPVVSVLGISKHISRLQKPHWKVNSCSNCIVDMFKTAPPPKSLLGYHRILSPTAAPRVSPLCLGGANFGDMMKDVLGECNKETT